jgi:hypothetical protein
MKQIIYDPPSGWQYGFPKPYAPLPGESFHDTLLRDGYPKSMLELADRATRMWEEETEDDGVARAPRDVDE